MIIMTIGKKKIINKLLRILPNKDYLQFGNVFGDVTKYLTNDYQSKA